MSQSSTCPFCARGEGTDPLDVAEMMFGWDETFTYLTCADYGTVWLPEIPDDLWRYYPQGYYSVDTDPEQALGRPGVRQFASACGASSTTSRAPST